MTSPKQKGPRKMRTLGKMAALAMIVAVAISAAGCFPVKAKHKTATNVSADMSVSGSITIYTSLPQEQSDKYLAAFKKEYPKVQTNVVRDTPWAIAQKLVKEKNAPVADVVWHTPLSSVYAAVEASSLASYAYHPGQLDAVQADYSDPDSPDHPMVTGTDARVIGFGVNTSKTGGATPQTFSDLTDSKYAGQVVMPSINSDAGYVLVASLLSNEDEDTAWQYLSDLDKNVAYYTTDGSAAAQAVANGDAGVAIAFDNELAKSANSSSVQLVWPGLPELSPYEIDVDALVKKPAPSKAALAFLDWAIGDNAMLQYANDTPVTSVDEGNAFPNGYPQSVSDQLMQNADWSYFSENHDKIVAEWMKRFGKKVKQ